MPKPVLVIVGRPNVGKSTLFNRIVGGRAAIVEDVPGVTRDRNYMDAVWEDKSFVAVDTGGFYTRTPDSIFEQIKQQALFAIDEADIIVHVLDGKDGLNPYDTELAEILRSSGKKTVWAVNKIDGPGKENLLFEFYGLGVEELVPLSAESAYNFDEFMDSATAGLPQWEEEEAEYPRVAVVGRPNAGKSTLVNSLLGKERMLVSEVPGTTRDSIDSVCSYYKRKYLLIDTAGIRRKQRTGYPLERFAMLRALRSIERSDVAIIVIDASEGIVSDDQKIAGLVREYRRGAILLLNKFDLVEAPEEALKRLRLEIEDKLWFFSHAPVLTTSGLTRKRITKVFPIIDSVVEQLNKRIGTPELNRFLPTLSLPPVKGKPVKLRYITQTGSNPPVFTVFSNRPEGVGKQQERYIESRLRERYSFSGVPLTVKVKATS